MSAEPKDWSAASYHRVSEPQRLWGERVLDALELRGNETVLDAGCGTGRLTARLLDRLPDGHVVALDASPAMLEKAREHLAPYGARVSFVCAALSRDALPAGMDVVFSTATFHWVLDHARLFRDIAACLRPGGRLHAQCGGAGNLDHAHAIANEVGRAEPFAGHLAGMPDPWLFAGVEDSVQRLTAAGFVSVHAELEDAPTSFPDAAAFSEFVRTVILRPFLARLPEPLHDAFVGEVTARAGRESPPYSLDYVRLNLRAALPD